MRSIVATCLLLALSADVAVSDDSEYVPKLDVLSARQISPLAEVVARYSTDRRAMMRRHDVEGSAQRRTALTRFYSAWTAQLATMDFDALDTEGRIDWLLLNNRIAREQGHLAQEEARWSEAAELVPFAAEILDLQVARRNLESVEPPALATELDTLSAAVDGTRETLARGLAAAKQKAGQTPPEGPVLETTRTLAQRSAGIVAKLRETLGEWFVYYDGYHPTFSWWVRQPHGKLDKALEEYGKFLRSEIVGEKEGEDPPIVGDPIGRQELLDQLAFEMIPYTPEELVAIAHQQFEWCDREMLRASRDLGFGDDWRAALEKVKTLHVEPGAQPDLVHRLADEAVEFLEERDLLTIPDLAKDIWRMEMMSPERQKINPFFTGGEVIRVSFPTDGMTHEEKWMSLRGNNIHFSRATVHHELIPGHHLQFFMTARHNSHRRAFSTPFWTEGWALYWEMLLWDLGFPQSPEDRIGMLFWRMHRCARIIFSLSFHLGQMTADEAVEFLVERVGHEPENAEAEVRRSFEDSYPPLYQAAYMLGGLQIRALHERLVGSGTMTDRDFHDAVLEGAQMPIEMVRARLLGLDLDRDYRPTWRFIGEPRNTDE